MGDARSLGTPTGAQVADRIRPFPAGSFASRGAKTRAVALRAQSRCVRRTSEGDARPHARLLLVGEMGFGQTPAMPQRITVYCRRSLDPGWLQRAIEWPDYDLAAEVAGIDEREMTEATASLLGQTNGDVWYAGAPRPIQVELYDRAMLGELIAEAREDASATVAGLLEEVVEIVGFELGFEQAEGIGGVIAEQIARAIAFATEGVVDFYGNDWRIVDSGRERVPSPF